MLHLIDVAKGFGKRTLFSGANLHIGPEDRIGLVGPNGCGKTTVFRMLAGEEYPESGEIRMRKGLLIGYLPQEIETQREGAVLRTIVDGVRNIGALRRQREELLVELERASEEGGDTDGLAAHQASLEEQFEHVGGYTIEAEAREVLCGLGFSVEDLERPLRTFSGGWQVRAELARLLLERPDLLLLDEPTNHLDLESIQWFEDHLASFGGAYVVVSHDREFLNRAVRRIVEVNPNGLKSYTGDYDRYRRQKEEDVVLQEKRYKEQQARIRELQDFIDRNRTRKDRARQVQSRIKTLDGIERLTPPRRESSIRFRFPQPERTGNIVMRVEGLRHAYGSKTVLSDVEFTLYRGDRIAIVGLNGAGKSTLLKILAGRLKPTEGILHIGSNVTIDYYAQHQLESLNADRTPLEEMVGLADLATAPMVRGILGAFHFSGDDVDKPIRVLSGGEKARVALAKMLLKPASLILLDEPTNHLDIASREVLERALAQYDGTLCVTSHDRRFCDTVATKVIQVADRGITDYPGNYSDYLWKRGQEQEAEAAAAPKQQTASAPRQRDMDRARKRREAEKRAKATRELKPLREQVKRLESAIEKTEERINTLALKLADPQLYRDPERSRKLGEEHDMLKGKLAEFYGTWEQVNEKLEEREMALGL